MCCVLSLQLHFKFLEIVTAMYLLQWLDCHRCSVSILNETIYHWQLYICEDHQHSSAEWYLKFIAWQWWRTRGLPHDEQSTVEPGHLCEAQRCLWKRRRPNLSGPQRPANYFKPKFFFIEVNHGSHSNITWTHIVMVNFMCWLG